MTSLFFLLFAAHSAGCSAEAGTLSRLSEAVTEVNDTAGVTVTAEVIGTFEREDGYQFTAVPGKVSGPVVLTIPQIQELSRSDGTVDGFLMVTSRGNFLADRLTVHVPGKGDAEFRPMIYGYPESPEEILPNALKLIDWQNRPRLRD